MGVGPECGHCGEVFETLDELLNHACTPFCTARPTNQTYTTGGVTMPFAVKDSGKREEFKSGMVRDTTAGKINFLKVLDGPMLERWAAHLTKGAVKYPDVGIGVANWTLANGAAELQRAKESAIRHFIQYLRGDTDEDHAAALYFNVNLAEYVKAKLNTAMPVQAYPEACGCAPDCEVIE